MVSLMGISPAVATMHEPGKGAATRRRNSCRHLLPPLCFREFKAIGPETPKDLRFSVFLYLVAKTSGDVQLQYQNSNFELFTSLLGFSFVFRFSQNLGGASKTRHFMSVELFALSTDSIEWDVTCLSGPLSAT